MSVLIKGLEMPETEYMDVRIFRDGTATIATGTKPYYRELKAEPVRHGKWRQTYLDHEAFGERPSIFYCSACCACSSVKTNYCPNCGCRMDKEWTE